MVSDLGHNFVDNFFGDQRRGQFSQSRQNNKCYQNGQEMVKRTGDGNNAQNIFAKKLDIEALCPYFAPFLGSITLDIYQIKSICFTYEAKSEFKCA